ncbi:MAG: hypothetical protein KGI54_08885 [Pseudomonadota bacterium]|nr:hypothetical protein [Pseudomonadota bacterium]
MAGITYPAYSAIPLSASGLAKSGAGVLGGIYVGTSTALTIKVWDSLTASGTVILETTSALTAGSFINLPVAFSTGCFITVGGAGTFTVLVA